MSSKRPETSRGSRGLTSEDTRARSCIISSRGGKAEFVAHVCLKSSAFTCFRVVAATWRNYCRAIDGGNQDFCCFLNVMWTFHFYWATGSSRESSKSCHRKQTTERFRGREREPERKKTKDVWSTREKRRRTQCSSVTKAPLIHNDCQAERMLNPRNRYKHREQGGDRVEGIEVKVEPLDQIKEADEEYGLVWTAAEPWPS